MRRKLLLTGIVVFIVILIIVISLFGRQVLNDNIGNEMVSEDSEEIETTDADLLFNNNAYVFGEYLHYLVNETWHFIEFEDFFTDNFIKRYTNYSEIYPELKNKSKIEISGGDVINDCGDKIMIELRWNDERGKRKLARIEYELTLTDEGKIDDFRMCDVMYYDPVTFNPLDGRAITLDEYYAEGYINVLWRPIYYLRHEDGQAYYKEYVDIPITNDCQIINLPSSNCNCEYYFPYYKATFFNEITKSYDDNIKYYVVDYDVNDKAQFTRIEFIELTEEEYNTGVNKKLHKQ